MAYYIYSILLGKHDTDDKQVKQEVKHEKCLFTHHNGQVSWPIWKYKYTNYNQI